MKKYDKSISIREVLPYIALVFIFVILVIRSFYSFCQSDESFYIALTNRLWLGDKLLLDEWNPAQFYASALLPFYAIYKLIVPSGDGVLLYFRLLYVVFAFCVSIYVYRFSLECTRKQLASLMAATIVMLYSRANICGMSYYNLAFLCCIIIICLCNKHKAPVLAGLLIAIGVLCNPYLSIIVVPLYIILIWKRNAYRKYYIQMLLVDICILCIYILVFFRNPLKQISSIRYVFTDSGHFGEFFDKVFTTIKYIYYLNYHGIYVILAVLLSILILLIKKVNEKVIHILWLGISLVMFVFALSEAQYSTTDVITLNIAISAVPFCVSMLKQRKCCKEGLALWIGGIVVALAFFMASNTLIDAMTVGFAISSVGSILIYNFVISDGKELENSRMKYLSTGLLIAIYFSIFACMFLQRVVGVYRDSDITQLDTQLTQGPAKGLYTFDEAAKQYNEILKTIEAYYLLNSNGKVLHYKWLPWAYLVTDWDYGTYSSWRIDTDISEKYYSICPEKVPDHIFVYEPNVGLWGVSRYNNAVPDDTPNEFESEELAKIIKDNRYKIVEQNEYVKIYQLIK